MPAFRRISPTTRGILRSQVIAPKFFDSFDLCGGESIGKKECLVTLRACRSAAGATLKQVLAELAEQPALPPGLHTHEPIPSEACARPTLRPGFHPIFRIEGAADHLDPEDWIPAACESGYRWPSCS